MHWFISLNLRSQMMVIILIMAIVPLGIILYSAEKQRSSDLHKAEQLASSLATAVENDQNVLMSGAEQLLSTLPYVQAVRKRDVTEVNRLLAELVQKNAQVTNLLMIAPDGTVWASALPMLKPINAADRLFFKKAMETGRFSSGEYTIGRVLSKPALSFGYPVRNLDGKISDMAVASYTLTNYDRLLKSRDIPRNTSLLLVDHKGSILFNITAPHLIGKQDRDDLFRKMKDGPDKGSFRGVSNTGVTRVFGYQKIYLRGEKTPYMYVRAGLDEEMVLKKSFQQLIANISIMLAIVVMAVFMAIYISKRAILDKINALRAATQKISSGDLSIRVTDHVAGGDLGELGTAFDRMAQQLSEDIARRELAEADALAKGAELDRYFNNSLDLLCIADMDGFFLRLNPAWEKTLGYPITELQGRTYMDFVHPDDIESTINAAKVLEKNNEIMNFINRYRHRDGSYRWIEWRSTRPDGIIVYATARDVTDRIKAEEDKLQLERQLLHAQKLESLGVLAGGIAHDFNNILMAIMGNAELALMRINKESPAVDNLKNIEQASARAADLAKQMLAYSGKGKFIVEPIDLNRLIEDMLHMLEVSISKMALLRINLHTPLPSIEADATQIRQIIMNLVINASEAIGDKSGVISLSTGTMECDRNYLKNVWLDENMRAGLYVCLEIADTGCGMERETIARIFDPFFTTKFTGRGLGMAAVLGIVRGHKGAIVIYSEPGKGATFKILFPAGMCPAEKLTAAPYHDDWRGGGTVLLVDDEETVRDIAADMLTELGFAVITADNGREAVAAFKVRDDISFVILDLTMPYMDGEQCFHELKIIKPDVTVLISSGFSEHEVTKKFAGKGLAGFIQKPYNLSVLKQAIRGIV